MDDSVEWLAVAVVERAINDARGVNLTAICRKRTPTRLAADALDWLRAGADGLLDVFGLDAAAVAERLQSNATRQEAHESARSKAR